ncbi:MAG: chromosomal replication initiation protein DnaA [Candidatus Pelagibacter sp. TMED64]|nr:chromosomal replication initiator protein DnaA [Candidatus Pelagibacter sp.]OUU65034.1 MAG: chromosomal replication initiation protein DnaA [Candidatus Pelagibacter sp. TMED64]|tara:strand:- start:4404 stop:5819 length:1416 start_codon:yes stop_codon:yes gene_type:complete
MKKIENLKQNLQDGNEENFLNWQDILQKLKKNFGNDIYESWIKNINLKKEYNHYLILAVPTRFIRDWVVSRYADKILDVIKENKETITRIEFAIEPIDIKSYENSISNSSNQRGNNLNNITPIEYSIVNYSRLDNNKSFENFVLGDSNKLAFTAAKKVCENFTHYNPLFIYGGVGMGKTHLLNSIGLSMKERFNVMFISAERFMYHFIKSIKNKEMVKFKDFFRKADVFIIDDIQFVRGKEVMQEEFFHTFNDLIDKGSQIVVSSDRAPANLDRIQERIKSRLSGGLVVDIQPADFNLRLAIIKNKLAEVKKNYPDTIDLDEDILAFLATKIRVNTRETIGALNRILAFSRIYKKSPNISECKTILKDVVESNINYINIEKIQTTVASHFKINIKEMLSAKRSRFLVRPRQIAMYLAKKHTTKSLPEIGRNFCGRDHTTVIHAVKTIDRLFKIDHEMKENINQIENIFIKY